MGAAGGFGAGVLDAAVRAAGAAFIPSCRRRPAPAPEVRVGRVKRSATRPTANSLRPSTVERAGWPAHHNDRRTSTMVQHPQRSSRCSSPGPSPPQALVPAVGWIAGTSPAMTEDCVGPTRSSRRGGRPAWPSRRLAWVPPCGGMTGVGWMATGSGWWSGWERRLGAEIHRAQKSEAMPPFSQSP